VVALACLALGLVRAALVLAAPATTPSAGPASFGMRASLVVLSATAVDKRGRPVHDLRAQDFTILEEGRPQTLVRFARAADAPARVLLLVDVSGSMNLPRATTSVRMAAVQVLAALGPADEVALCSFDSDYRALVPFTRDHERVRRGLEATRPFGATALHDALAQAANELSAQGESRRAIVVITDGVDTASRQHADDVLARSRALDVPIYAISVVSPLDDPASPYFAGGVLPAADRRGRDMLQRYAALSGGAAFTVSDFAALRGAAQRVAAELKHQYRLGYDAPMGPGHFRRIEVRSSRKGVQVRTRSGYVPLS
jgi:VWFA-related protein